MKEKISKNRIALCNMVFPGLVVVVCLLFALFLPDQNYSTSERRILAGKPKVTIENIQNGKYMSEFESYTLDQFPFRDVFRRFKTMMQIYVLRQKDKSGYYLAERYLSKLEYPMNEGRLEKSIRLQQELYDIYLKNTDCTVYQSIIPDKNYFLAMGNGYPSMDYADYEQRVKAGANYAQYMDLFSELELPDYYHTDPHFRQENLKKVVEKVDATLKLGLPMHYHKITIDEPFYGAYYEQAALPVKPDSLSYLTNETIESCIVTSYNTGKAKKIKIYDEEKAYSIDPYEMFLGGSNALVEIENPKAETDRQLIVFRDSFGSSLIPLLVEGYQKITLVDLRYLRLDSLGQFVTFTNQDVWFLYSTLIY